ncbi:Protein ltv1 [Tilletia horrida]|uniref:Protein ltv1 n=1 Tax=Tilletia horrida TaxID=155126 RepID=A0AAN6GKE5_9BASI|nr:Protein ltv1 [Tilletia horrida]KAK0549492.1 Protein ltv1 [Tilletia horrida]KAK0561756.1 Protein ltv1 [Tilletia horrida]
MAPSIWRSKDAQHFQVVHRSQRDPLINDPLAPQHVLKQVNRPNEAARPAGTSRADLEASNPELAKLTRSNVGEAALYGIYYDDTDYDYMQHLRPIGGDYHSKRGGQDEEDNVDTILISAKPNKQQQKRDQKALGEITLKDDQSESGSSGLQLPAELLPPQESTMRKLDYTSQLDTHPSIAGLQPNMDPHLRQALEALDDEAFLTLGPASARPTAAETSAAAGSTPTELAETPANAKASSSVNAAEDGDVDDFFSQVLAGGEVDEEDFGHEDGPNAEDWRALPPGGDEAMWTPEAWAQSRTSATVPDESQLLREAISQHKKATAAAAAAAATGGRASGSRVARSKFSTGTATSSIFSASSKRKPGQRARLAASVAPSINDGRTEWSMTSSSMRRNQGLSTLDDQFEALQRRYEAEEGFNEEDEEEYDEEEEEEQQDDEADEDGVGKKDVAAAHEAIYDKFLASTELVGRRVVEALGPDGNQSSATQRLGALRDGLGPLEERYKLDALERKEGDDLPAESDPTFPWRREPKNSRHAWDVETILSTHSNTTNHPRMIKARDAASTASTAHRAPSMITDPLKDAKSKVNGTANSINGDAEHDDEEDEGSDYDSDATEVPAQITVKRDRNESAEDKKARKAALKEQKQARRQQKSARKAVFAAEHKKQVHMATARTAGGAAADVGRNGVPLTGGRSALTM